MSLKLNMETGMKLSIWIIIMTFTIVSCSKEEESMESPDPTPLDELNIETFTFSTNGVDTHCKIFLPAAYDTNKNLPAIYLIDYREQHFSVAYNEFDKVIDGVEQIINFDAIVVTLEEIPNIDAEPIGFQEYYDVYKNMTYYVDSIYTDNTSRTFIGRGSEAGVVIMSLLLENSETSVFDNFIATDSPDTFNSFIINMLEDDNFPLNKSDKKLHFSFSGTNNYVKCAELINLIESKQYPWLAFESKQYPNNVYENTYPLSFAAGIKFVFNK